jgi:hypothetical protein
MTSLLIISIRELGMDNATSRPRDKRFLWTAIVVMLACGATAIGVNVFYNEAHEARGLDRATFQVLFLTLLAAALLANLAVMWFWTSAQDEVVRTADRVSVYWGYAIGTFVWLITPYLTSLPERLVEPLSNPDGDTLFALSEAAGAYMGGGLVLIILVLACCLIVNVCWWLAKR